MNLVRLYPDNASGVLLFLERYETFCASLCSGIIEYRKDIEVYTLQRNGEIRGVFSLSKNGSVLHCFPFIEDFSSYESLLSNFFYGHRLFCVNGEVHGSLFLTDLFFRMGLGVPLQFNHYILMFRKCGSRMAAGRSVYRAIRCSVDNIEDLMPLESAYQMEEVLPVGQQLDYGLCRQQLLRTLRNRIVFAVPHPAGTGAFVSKAGTNASGIHCSQLGGVYTLPSCRNLGYGFSAVTAIVQLLEQQKRDCVLFVKEKNISASTLYKTAGFNTSGYYIIAYYS